MLRNGYTLPFKYVAHLGLLEKISVEHFNTCYS